VTLEMAVDGGNPVTVEAVNFDLIAFQPVITIP
jgi:hypothetical protein